MITIGQLAGYAGVTIKAVRHYHRRGLLDEPPHDSSGSAHDPRLHALAKRGQRWLTNRASRATAARPVTDPMILHLIATLPNVASPAWQRLAQVAVGGGVPARRRKTLDADPRGWCMMRGDV